jgi:hypothetical protein
MFTADEVSSVVDLAKLKELKHRIVNLFLYANDGGRGSTPTISFSVQRISWNLWRSSCAVTKNRSKPVPKQPSTTKSGR